GQEKVLGIINGGIHRDVESSVPLQVLHRHDEDLDIYFVFNPAGSEVEADLRFRTTGRAEIWDPWTGKHQPLAGGRSVTIALAAREAKVIVVRESERPAVEPDLMETQAGTQFPLTGEWQCRIHPSLDNRHGDFSLPASDGLLGPQARRFRCSDEFAPDDAWLAPAYDDSAWRMVSYSFGPQLEVAGPFPPGTEAAEESWRPYEFSRRWGIERDPFLTDWLSGPHGLKGMVPDEFLDFDCGKPGHCWFARGVVSVPDAGDHLLVSGARCAYEIWIDGRSVVTQTAQLPPGRHKPWNIPHYDCEHRETPVRLDAGVHQVVVKLIQPEGQRARAFFAFDPPEADQGELALRWFRDPAVLRACLLAPPSRRAIRFRFTCPPGAREMSFVARGKARVVVDGNEAAVELLESLPGGCFRYRAEISRPSPCAGTVCLRVEAPADSHGGDALPEPVDFVCGEGRLPAGDWCAYG
ncbi:MAG: hypothetical protein KDN05_23185, partial [Verrucomicrobiae bacterium]|nr:hypothetical protein [Verrucomicrobiae bacterium]